MGSYTRGTGFMYFEWTSSSLSVALWLSFCVYFDFIFKLMRNRVGLCEPADRFEEEIEEGTNHIGSRATTL